MVCMVIIAFYILCKEKCDRIQLFSCKVVNWMIELTPCTAQGPACRNAPVNGFRELSTTSTQYA